MKSKLDQLKSARDDLSKEIAVLEAETRENSRLKEFKRREKDPSYSLFQVTYPAVEYIWALDEEEAEDEVNSGWNIPDDLAVEEVDEIPSDYNVEDSLWLY